MKYFVFLLFTPFFMFGQDLGKHQWENRIIVISSPSLENEDARKQLNELSSDIEAMADRKLIVYHRTNSGYNYNFDKSKLVPIDGQTPINTFSVCLIGLDGTEKFRASTSQKIEKFFGMIDSMPMRQTEIKNR